MAEKKTKTKEIKDTSREKTHEDLKLETELTIKFKPNDLHKIKILAEIAHGENADEYCKKVLLQHLNDRLYLVRK